MKNSLIFTPNSLQLHKNGYLQGFHEEFDDCHAYYVTDPKVSKLPEESIGVSCNGVQPDNSKPLSFDNSSGKICLKGSPSGFVRITYDYQSFRNGSLNPAESEYGAHFKLLMDKLKCQGHKREPDNGKQSVIYKIMTLIDLILVIFQKSREFGDVFLYSATITHVRADLLNLKSFLGQVGKKNNRETPRIGNFICAKVFDFVAGLLILNLVIRNEKLITELTSSLSREIITSFKDLLSYLMGSPIGLKLNHSFNKSLGTFFFYHISLWRVFLETIQPFIRDYFMKLYMIIGALGLSYQVSMLSDVISLATFHVYCIYVYAARLFYLQLKGLLSLWRLFIGRKYNPLRQRVDSYHYSQNQLFIGTLGFTILLFLLPTTGLYYTVFTIFRLVILFVDRALGKLRICLHTLPIYVVFLWILRSPHLAGPICIKFKNSEDCLHFEANLKILPLAIGVEKFSLKAADLAGVRSPSYGSVFHKIFTGVLI